MPLWDIIPTCNDEMSCYTLVALCIFAVIGSGIGSIAYWWTSHEFKDIKKSVCGHDQYIAETSMVISDMKTKLAVQQSALTEIKDDIADLKHDLKADIAAMQADIKQLLSR